MATLTLGPIDKGNGQLIPNCHEWAFIVGAQTAVLARGRGCLHTVQVGVVGTLAKFYDCAPGGTTDATTQIATVSLAGLNNTQVLLDVCFSEGLTCIVTGAAEITVSYRGKIAASRTIRRAASTH